MTLHCFCMLDQTAFFLQFKDAHPEYKIAQRTFERMKPWYFRPLKERNVCCCIYHVEMDLMRVGLNTMRDQVRGLHTKLQCSCFCPVCSRYPIEQVLQADHFAMDRLCVSQRGTRSVASARVCYGNMQQLWRKKASTLSSSTLYLCGLEGALKVYSGWHCSCNCLHVVMRKHD